MSSALPLNALICIWPLTVDFTKQTQWPRQSEDVQLTRRCAWGGATTTVPGVDALIQNDHAMLAKRSRMAAVSCRQPWLVVRSHRSGRRDLASRLCCAKYVHRRTSPVCHFWACYMSIRPYDFLKGHILNDCNNFDYHKCCVIEWFHSWSLAQPS